jgi:hypothetical protein
MDIVILPSAYKHGITEESIYACLFNCMSDIVLENPPLKRLIVGFDHRGNAVEIIALEESERRRLVVIHAMRLRKKYYSLLSGDSNEL